MHRLEALLNRLEKLANDLYKDKRWHEAHDIRCAIEELKNGS